MSFLDDIRATTRERISSLPKGEPTVRPPRSLLEALRGRNELSICAEVKRCSPGRGVIRHDVDAVAYALGYERSGAAAISVLTEPTRFGGSFHDLAAVSRSVALPCLMKDFVIDPDQVRAGALLGAAAVLVIVKMLDEEALVEISEAARRYGLDALVECHDEADVERALALGARLVGINNRNLDTLEIDRRTAPALAARIPDGVVVVAESGYEEPEQLREIQGLCDAALIGTALMRAERPGDFMSEASACA